MRAERVCDVGSVLGPEHRSGLLDSFFDIYHVCEGFVIGQDRLGGVLSLRQRLGKHDRDRLPHEPDDITGEHLSTEKPLDRAARALDVPAGRLRREVNIGRRENRGNAGHLTSLRDIQPRQPGMGHDGAHEYGSERPLDPDVFEVAAFPAKETRVFGSKYRDAEERWRHRCHWPMLAGRTQGRANRCTDPLGTSFAGRR